MKSFTASETGAEREYVVKMWDDADGDRSHYVRALNARAAMRAAMRLYGWRTSGAYDEQHINGHVPMTFVKCGRGREMCAFAFSA